MNFMQDGFIQTSPVVITSKLKVVFKLMVIPMIQLSKPWLIFTNFPFAV